MSKHWYSNVISPFILAGRHNSNSRHLPLRYHGARLFMSSPNLLQSGNVRDSCRWQWTVCFAAMRREKDAISGMMADYGAAQYASLRLNLQPRCLPRTAWSTFPLLSAQFFLHPPSLFPAPRRPLGAKAYFYISQRCVLNIRCHCWSCQIIQFLPVSSITWHCKWGSAFCCNRRQVCRRKHVRSFKMNQRIFEYKCSTGSQMVRLC